MLRVLLWTFLCGVEAESGTRVGKERLKSANNKKSACSNLRKTRATVAIISKKRLEFTSAREETRVKTLCTFGESLSLSLSLLFSLSETRT